MEEYFESMRRGAVFDESDEDLPAAPNLGSPKSAAPQTRCAQSRLVQIPLERPSPSRLKPFRPKPPYPNSPCPNPPESVSSKHPSPSIDPPVTKAEVKVEEDVKMEEGDVLVEEYNRVINHVLKCMTSLCGFKKAQEAANSVPLYEKNGEPKWFKQEGNEEILVPHFDCSFQENVDGWGKVFDAVVENPSRMPAKDRAHLQTISNDIFRPVLSAGAFATVKEAWKKNQDGKRGERQEKKRAHSRRGDRKGALNADAAFQSSDYSDPENKKRSVIHEPGYQTEMVTQLLGALDRKHNSIRKRGENPVYTEFDYRLVDVPVPSLSTFKGKVQGWAINTEAIKGDLERESWPYIFQQG
ncbi:hypothetical protein FRC08_016136 [Ceratobasidium sp. 394]|nr:hypothetical protein FRC08_016136 [Ceratobasidium sp. 394]KAG9096644.1 hypothetical protein FS749_008059 [Ceratobasidium sp. UAMH 11750]